MALVVVAVGSTWMLSVASTSAHLVDRANMEGQSAHRSTQALAIVLRNGCRDVPSEAVALPRLLVHAQPTVAGAVHGVSVHSAWEYTPFSGGTRRPPHRDSTSTAVWCEP